MEGWSWRRELGKRGGGGATNMELVSFWPSSLS